MKKILIVFGTRPEAIKMAPVIKALENIPELFYTKVCITAQHREMLDQVLEIFDITPHYDLNIMQANQDLYDVTSKVLLKMREILIDFKPDIVLVHGDTTTSSAAALAAYYQKIPVGHVEAGLRTGNIYSPWPEEMNRKITGSISSLHFAPTEISKQNLLDENVQESNIIVTGNTVIDALLIVSRKLNEDKLLKEDVRSVLEMSFVNFKEILDSKFILVTGHRRENFGDGFVQICKALKDIALTNPEMNVIYPVHLNPNVQEPVYELLNNVSNVHLIKPLSYMPFIYLLEKCFFVLTDSGGIQEEAPSFGKPVLVMRNTTERPEAVNAGTVKLVGANQKLIVAEAQKLIRDKSYYESMSKAHNPYGDGHASERIASFVKSYFTQNK